MNREMLRGFVDEMQGTLMKEASIAEARRSMKGVKGLFIKHPVASRAVAGGVAGGALGAAVPADSKSERAGNALGGAAAGASIGALRGSELKTKRRWARGWRRYEHGLGGPLREGDVRLGKDPKKPGKYKFTVIEGGKDKASGVMGNVGAWAAKNKEHLTHGAELAGLGALAVPSAGKLRKIHAKETSPEEKSHAKYELGGLGILAAPSAIHLGHAAWKAVRH
jgi:hypothetical protein